MAGNVFRYTPEEKQWMFMYIPGHHHRETAAAFYEQFGHPITVDQVGAFCKNNKIRTGFDGRFKPGHPSPTKGKKMKTTGRMAETQFKAGHVPWNYKPVGSERINVDGYIEIKVADPNKWRLKQRVVWEQENGPIPAGMMITFRDNDKTNCSIDNLIMISMKQNQAINRMRLANVSPEMKDTVLALADLKIATSEAKRRNQ